MNCVRSAAALAVAAGLSWPAAALAQFGMVSNIPGTFTDISGTGNTLLTAPNDDGYVSFSNSVTNALVTSSTLQACVNGWINVSGTPTSTYTNSTLPATAAGDMFLCPFWDDLYLYNTTAPGGVLMEKETTENGIPVHIIEWVNIRAIGYAAGTPTNFEVKIWGAGGPALVQYLYQDMSFAGAGAATALGGSATAGVQWSTTNALTWSYNNTSPGVQSNSVLSVYQLQNTGACCVPNNQVCILTDAAGCTAAGGTFAGPGSVCASANCPVPPFCNGDFEIGSFSCWNLVGNQTYNAVNSGAFVTITPHGGTYEGHFGPIAPNTGGISQTIGASPGDQVTIDFWYAVEPNATPNLFSADFDGQNLMSLTNDITNTVWTEFNFQRTVTNQNPLLSFTFQNSPLYDYLDDVVVTVTHVATCYPNCDNSTTVPFLNVADFTCFLQKFASANDYANCDHSTTPPTLNVADFTCFLQKFAAGCSAP